MSPKTLRATGNTIQESEIKRTDFLMRTIPLMADDSLGDNWDLT